MGTDQAIKVCHIISGDLWAGAEVQAFELLRELNKSERLELTAIVLNEGKLARKLKEMGVEVHIIDESRHGFFEIVKRSGAYLADRNADIVHSHRYKENILAGRLKKAGLVNRLVQTVHGYPEPFRFLSNLKARLYHAWNRRCTNKYFDYLIAVSDDLRDKIADRVDRGRIITIRNSIDPGSVKPSRTRSEVRDEFGFPESTKVIASAGRMVPVKAYDTFLKAAKAINAEHPNIRFMLVGDGPEKSALMRLSKELDLEDVVIFPGFRDDIIDILSGIDLFVLSSQHEGIPMVLLEAMALGIPVVSTSVGGIKEVIEDGLCGLLVEPESPEQMASTCLKVLSDEQLYEKLSGRGKLRIAEEFSVNKQARKVEKIYIELAGGGQ